MSETRHFEKTTGGVVRRWQISREGIRCHMGWGRVGGTNRSMSMTLDDEAHAERHFKKKISEKKRQGYVEVEAEPAVKAAPAKAEAMADATLLDVIPEKDKGWLARAPVEGRKGVFATLDGPLFCYYLVLSADERRGVYFIVKKPGHDLAHVSAFLDFVLPRVDLAFDGRSHHKAVLPFAVGQFNHALFCAPSLCDNQYMGRLGMVFPILDCEIGDEDTETFVEVRIHGRDSIPWSTWDREPFPVIDLKFELHSETGFEELGRRSPFREKTFKVYRRGRLDQALRLLSVATPDSRLEIRNYRRDVLTIAPADLTPATPAEVDRFLLEGARPV